MNNKRLKSLKILLIIFGILIIAFLIIYALYGKISPQKEFDRQFDTQFRNMVEEYMEKKYGNQNFKVKSYQKKYHHTEFSQMFDYSDKYFVGYTVSVTSNVVPETSVSVKGTELEKMTISDMFLKDYYAIEAGIDMSDENYIFDNYYNWEKLEDVVLQGEIPKNKCEEFKEYLYNKSELINEIKISNNDFGMSIDIPEDLGHIPTKYELGKFAEIKSAIIKTSIKEGNQETFMQELRQYINEYFNNTKNVDIKPYHDGVNIDFHLYLNNKD